MAESTVYQRLKIIREWKKMEIPAFAESIGAEVSNYRKQEKGVLKPDFAHSIVVRACETYNINANWLLFGEEPMEKIAATSTEKLQSMLFEALESNRDWRTQAKYWQAECEKLKKQKSRS